MSVEGDTETPSSLPLEREPKGPPLACLFVANLPHDVTEDRVNKHFSQFGPVLKVKLIKDSSSRPYCFVQFGEIDHAQNCMKSNKLFEGKRIRIEKAKVNRTLFIAKMSRTLGNAQLREQAETYGPVESVTVIKNHVTEKSKGCGFVKYVYREDALDAYVGLKYANKKWVVEWATSMNDPDLLGVDKFNIFVGGLNRSEITKKMLEDRFTEYGEIESVTLINREDPEDPETTKSAFAFVRYTDASSSAIAIEAANGEEWLGRRIRVQYCESADMKTKRIASKMSSPALGYTSPSQFYNASPAPNRPVSSNVPATAPVLVMGSMPMFSQPPDPGSTQKLSYSRKGYSAPAAVPSAPVYGGGYPAYPINPVVLSYPQQPWLFTQQGMGSLQPTAPQPPPPPSPFTSYSPKNPRTTSGHHPHNRPPHHRQSYHRSPLPPSSTTSTTTTTTTMTTALPRHQPSQMPSSTTEDQYSQQSTTSTEPHLPPLLHHQHQRGRDSPSSDDSLGNEPDSSLTQSMAAWVLK